MPARLIITGISDTDYRNLQTDYGPPKIVDNQIRWINGTIEIDYTYNDFLEKYRTLQGWIRRATGRSDRDQMMQAFATDFYRQEQAQQLDARRDGYRNFDWANHAPADPGLNAAMSQQTAVAQTLGAGDGLVLGSGHSDTNSKAMLCDLLDDGTLGNNQVGMLFIEEIKTWIQPELNNYFAQPAGAQMPKKLADYLDGLNKGFWKTNVPAKNFKTLVEKAQARGVKVYGIDSGEADPGCDNKSSLHPERRCALMNQVAADVIQQAKRDPANRGRKMIALVGKAHANSHEGGIPGLAQLFDVPAVVLDQNDKVQFLPDQAANHAMPTKAEQAFMDRFLAEIEQQQGPLPDPSAEPDYKTVMRKFAREQAAELRVGGRLNSVNDVDRALRRPEVQAKVRGRAEYNKVRTKTNLQQSVAEGRFDFVNFLLCDGADPTTSGMSWQQLAFSVAEKRNDKQRMQQAEALDTLLASSATNGVNIDAANSHGRTLAHLAAWNGNDDALMMLHGRHADMTKTDSRGWTACQTALASDKPQAEQFFYDNNIAQPATLLPGGNASFDTVQMLMSATQTEKPAARQRMEDMYKRLYANDSLRPVLDLMALDAARPRTPLTGGGLRIIGADGADVKHLYHGSGNALDRGAYADEGHVMMCACPDLGALDPLAGTLIHELTHASARLLYGQETIPAEANSQQMSDYKAAIEADVREMHLLNERDSMEGEIKESIAGRMAAYSQRAQGQGKHPDTKLLQEFLVAVPQLIAQYGEPAVQRYAPHLLNYFKDYGQKIRAKIQADPRYSTAAARLDNTQLVANLPARNPQSIVPADRRTKTAEVFTAASVKQKLEAEFRLRHGQFDATRANGATIGYDATNYALSTAQEKQLNAAKKAVDEVWAKLSADTGAPPTLSLEDVKGLIGGLADCAAKPPKQIKDAMRGKAADWGRTARKSYVEHQINHHNPPKIVLTDEELAEAIVIEAEDRTLALSPATNPGAAIEVNAEKHRKLVEDLTGKLKGLPANKKQGTAQLRQIMDTLAGSVAGGSDLGVYKKDHAKTQRTAHVSIDVAHARHTWLQTLSTL